MPHQVAALDDVDRRWGAVPEPLGGEPTPSPADDRDPRVRLQPRRARGGRAPREQSQALMALESAADGPEASASPPGPLVEPDPPGGRT
jgi:hypothetical protein